MTFVNIVTGDRRTKNEEAFRIIIVNSMYILPLFIYHWLCSPLKWYEAASRLVLDVKCLSRAQSCRWRGDWRLRRTLGDWGSQAAPLILGPAPSQCYTMSRLVTDKQENDHQQCSGGSGDVYRVSPTSWIMPRDVDLSQILCFPNVWTSQPQREVQGILLKVLLGFQSW